MKKRLFNVFAIILIICFAPIFTGCKKHQATGEWLHDDVNHWHKCEKCEDEVFDKAEHTIVDDVACKKCSVCGAEFAYSDDENFNVWLAGRDYSKEVDDNYVVTFDGKGYENGEFVSSSDEFEARSGGKYYYSYKENKIDTAGNATEVDKMTAVIKEVDDNGKTRIKFVRRVTENGTNTEYGYFVSPEYIDKLIEFSPKHELEMYGLDATISTYAEMVTHLKTLYTENSGAGLVGVDISIMRNSDGSVSLIAKAEEVDIDDELTSDSDYINTVHTTIYEFVVKNGKFDSYKSNETSKATYTIGSKNVISERNTTATYNYNGFDNAYYNGLDMNTGTTTNLYTASVTFVINGYIYENYDRAPVGDIYYASQAADFFLNEYSLVNVNKNMFKFYTDEAMTTEFTGEEITTNGVTLYVRFTPPEGSAIVMFVCNSYKGERLKILQVLDLDYTYEFDAALHGYAVTEVDGVAITNETEITLTENKVYIIKGYSVLY